MTAGRLLYAARKAERNGNKAKAEEIYTRLVKDFPESEEAISAKMDLLEINPIIANEVLASEETCKISSNQENSDPMSNRDVGTLKLHDYMMNSDGISRKELNIFFFLGLFIFGWLLTIVFDSLGKKVLGWLYILSIYLFSDINTGKILLDVPCYSALHRWVGPRQSHSFPISEPCTKASNGT